MNYLDKRDGNGLLLGYSAFELANRISIYCFEKTKKTKLTKLSLGLAGGGFGLSFFSFVFLGLVFLGGAEGGLGFMKGDGVSAS